MVSTLSTSNAVDTLLHEFPIDDSKAGGDVKKQSGMLRSDQAAFHVFFISKYSKLPVSRMCSGVVTIVLDWLQ